MPEAICVGIIVADVLARPVEGLPPRGQLAAVEEMKLQSGGCAANTGIGLARIGIPTALMGKVGSDGFGDFVVSAAAREGVDISGVVRAPTVGTSATMVLVHGDGERTFLHYYGANAELQEEDLDFRRFRDARLLHLAGHFLMTKLDGEPAARVLKRAREAGLKTSLDTCWDATGRWMSLLRPCLPHVDYFLPSLAEAEMLTGRSEPEEIAAALLGAGAGTVGLKMGGQGCYVRSPEASLRLPAHAIPCLDATGAGDAFVAGFLAGVLKGWDLEASARLGNAVGAMACLAVGTTAGIGSLEETLAFQAATPLVQSPG